LLTMSLLMPFHTKGNFGVQYIYISYLYPLNCLAFIACPV